MPPINVSKYHASANGHEPVLEKTPLQLMVQILVRPKCGPYMTTVWSRQW